MISPELLRRYPFFAGLNDAQIKALAMIADEVSYPAGTVILEERQDANWFFLLIDGGIDLSYKSEESYHPKSSKIFQVGEINPGEIFGLSALIEPFRYSATAVAAQTSQMIKFDGKSLRTFSDLDCSLGYHLMLQVAKATLERLNYTRVLLAAAQT